MTEFEESLRDSVNVARYEAVNLTAKQLEAALSAEYPNRSIRWGFNDVGQFIFMVEGFRKWENVEAAMVYQWRGVVRTAYDEDMLDRPIIMGLINRLAKNLTTVTVPKWPELAKWMDTLRVMETA